MSSAAARWTTGELAQAGGSVLHADSETRLVEAAQNGHLESFGVLYKRYCGSMVALAYSMLGDRDLAEDAAQEVFAVACRDLGTLRRRERFAAWLTGICRNTAKQMLRARGKQAILRLLPDDQEPHDRQVHLSETVRRAVGKLRPREREVVVLRYYENASYEHMASLLGISIQAVNGRLIRARRRIAEYLRREGVTEESYGRFQKRQLA